MVETIKVQYPYIASKPKTFNTMYMKNYLKGSIYILTILISSSLILTSCGKGKTTSSTEEGTESELVSSLKKGVILVDYREKKKVGVRIGPDYQQILGVNNCQDLEFVEEILKTRARIIP